MCTCGVQGDMASWQRLAETSWCQPLLRLSLRHNRSTDSTYNNNPQTVISLFIRSTKHQPAACNLIQLHHPVQDTCGCYFLYLIGRVSTFISCYTVNICTIYIMGLLDLYFFIEKIIDTLKSQLEIWDLWRMQDPVFLQLDLNQRQKSGYLCLCYLDFDLFVF